MGIIYFNGKSSDELNVVIEHFPNYTVPVKDYKTVNIPGKNGTYIVDLGTYRNVERSYEIAIADPEFKNDFSTMVNPVVEWLLSTNGYCKLYDSYDPEYYRLATVKSGFEITNLLNEAGRCTITFDCKPEKYLITGDVTETTSDNLVLFNPFIFESKPIIKIYGNTECDVVIGKYQIQADLTDETYVTIDTETMNCYHGPFNFNNKVEFNGYGFPKLQNGINNVSIISGATKVEVIPRWWTI